MTSKLITDSLQGESDNPQHNLGQKTLRTENLSWTFLICHISQTVSYAEELSHGLVAILRTYLGKHPYINIFMNKNRFFHLYILMYMCVI